jgi:hypothetical protein
MKMNPKSIKERFNKLAKKGGEAIIRVEAEWNASGLAERFGEWQEGKMAICVFNGAVQENTQNLFITNVTENKDGLTVNVRTGILGGPPSRPGHFSYPQDVKFVDDSDKPVKFEYAGIVQPLHRQTPPKRKR